MTGTNDEYAVSVLWYGDGMRCDAIADGEKGDVPCDLRIGHDGAHVYILDHDADGDPSLLATWASNASSKAVPDAD